MTRDAPGLPAVLARVAAMVAAVVALVVLSGPARAIADVNARIAVNLVFFVVLGALDEVLLGAALARVPLARAAALVAWTLSLGWFFSPSFGSRALFFGHVGGFFPAVLVGAALVVVARRFARG